MYDPRQLALMQKMFQSPNGPTFNVPQGGGGINLGAGAGAGAGMMPSFQGPDGAPGVQDIPNWDPSQVPDFQNMPFDPSQDPGVQDLGGMNPQPMPAPPGGGGWSPAARGGQSVARPMPADPNHPGTARPMPMPMPHRPSPMGNGAYPKDLGGAIQGAAGMRGSDGMPRIPSKMGPNMDRMPQSGNPYGPNMDNMPGGQDKEALRKKLIQAILQANGGG